METNPSLQRPVPAVSRIPCSNVQGLARNLSDLTKASSEYDILFCSETLVSDMYHVSELQVSGFGCPLVVLGQDALGPRDGCIRTRWLRQSAATTLNPNLRVVVGKMLVFRVCGVRQNLYVLSLLQP